MASDEDDDLYDEEFDFVDDDEALDEDAERGDDAGAESVRDDVGAEEAEEPVDEYGRPETPPANYVVHIYEHKKFKRTIDRPFTPEDAEAFATEFNRTSKSYGRCALAGKNDTKPKKALD
ncbi:MAG TPA: hypothetical protein VHE81_11190 [Lacipirellulaceae bacterium]|nr:hypothetical protein [Lacipirellulaceae bacterium]